LKRSEVIRHALGTLDRTPPPFFKQGPSALSKLMVFSALALFLMVADTRFKHHAAAARGVATVLYPVQWVALRPVLAVRQGGRLLRVLHSAQATEAAARRKLILQSQRANQVEQLALENARLRKLLDLRERLNSPLDPGGRSAVRRRRPVHAQGHHRQGPGAGRVRRLAGDRRIRRAGAGHARAPADQRGDAGHRPRPGHPVLNTRTGARSVAYGDPTGTARRRAGTALHGRQRRRAAGDLLTTSGVDGVYPAGLPVAKVDKVERRADSAFARIYCVPQALVDGARHVMVLKPVAAQIPPRPAPKTRAAAQGAQEGPWGLRP
jgi:rod shape-determining protein MreC